MLSAYTQAASLRETVWTRSSLPALHAGSLHDAARELLNKKAPMTNSIMFVCRGMTVSSYLVLGLVKSVPDNKHHHLESRNKLSDLF